MAIDSSYIWGVVKAKIDEENPDANARYTWANDGIPNINSAMDFIVAVFNSIFAQKKLSEECLSDLIRNRVYITSEYGRVTFAKGTPSDILWSTLAFHLPITYAGTLSTHSDLTTSVLCESARFLTGVTVAKRLTAEEWDLNLTNDFTSGSTRIFPTSAYRSDVNYISSGTSPNFTYPTEYELRYAAAPYVNLPIAWEYLKKPNYLTLANNPNPGTGDIQLPAPISNILIDRVWELIGEKEGDDIKTMDAVMNEVIGYMK